MLENIDDPQGLQPDIRNTTPELRALRFGELLDTIFSVYRTYFWSFFGIASGYFITIAIAISIAFFDDSIERGVRVAIWVTYCHRCLWDFSFYSEQTRFCWCTGLFGEYNQRG